MTSFDMFRVVEKDGLRLITPGYDNAVSNAGWSYANLHHRSRVETIDGTTVSQGFKKFFNLGQGPNGLRVEVADVFKACGSRDDVIATLKLDGSLLIRSVWNGQVMFRTRGSFGYDKQDNADEVEQFKERYPKLFDPNVMPGISILMEWTSPRNTIVLKYHDPELTIVGAITHNTFEYFQMRSLAIVSAMTGVPLVEHFKLNAEGFQQLYAKLDENNDIEGYVIRLDAEQTLVKVKCGPYLTKHALKSSLDTEGLVDMYLELKRPTFAEFVEHFQTSFDEEVCMWAYGAICALFDGVREYQAIMDHMAKKAASRIGLSRKETALAGIAEYGQTKRFSAYMLLWEGKTIPRDMEKSIILQNTKQVELGMFRKLKEGEGE